MRILITGSREYTDYWNVRDAIILACRPRPTISARAYIDSFVGCARELHTVVHGGARGADQLAKRVILEAGGYFDQDEFLADWDKDGRAAGPIRNQKMVDLGADICLAFPKIGAKNKGTFDCINRCLRAGIKVETFPA